MIKKQKIIFSKPYNKFPLFLICIIVFSIFSISAFATAIPYENPNYKYDRELITGYEYYGFAGYNIDTHQFDIWTRITLLKDKQCVVKMVVQDTIAYSDGTFVAQNSTSRGTILNGMNDSHVNSYSFGIDSSKEVDYIMVEHHFYVDGAFCDGVVVDMFPGCDF